MVSILILYDFNCKYIRYQEMSDKTHFYQSFLEFIKTPFIPYIVSINE